MRRASGSAIPLRSTSSSILTLRQAPTQWPQYTCPPRLFERIRLILDPDTNHVKAAVIRKGVFLSRDREVSRDRMDITPGGPIRLSSSAKEVNTLPEFDPVAYTTPPPDYPLPAGYPSERMYLPFGYGRGTARSVTDRGVMAGNAVSREVGAAWCKF